MGVSRQDHWEISKDQNINIITSSRRNPDDD
jgi:hypothetical protein